MQKRERKEKTIKCLQTMNHARFINEVSKIISLLIFFYHINNKIAKIFPFQFGKNLYNHGLIKQLPYLISTIEMRVFWLGIKCLKSATRLLNRVCVGRQGLDLSKEVLRVSVDQLVAKLQAVKVKGLKKILPRSMSRGGPDPQYLFWKI